MQIAQAKQSFYELQAANRRNSVFLIILFLFLIGALGLGFDVFFLGFDPTGENGPAIPVATLGALVFGAIYAAQGWFFGAQQVLASTSAREANPNAPEERQLLNVVEEMSLAAGIIPPKTYVVPDEDPNAFAVGRDPQHASIAVTEGLLSSLTREELQGVIGHEMSHVRNYDIRAMTLVTALFGAAAMLSDLSRRGLYWGGGSSRGRSRGGDRDGGGGAGGALAILFIVWALLAILAPLFARMIAMAVSRSREYLADASSAELTRNPLGLASALRKLAEAREPTRAIQQGSAHLCIVDPRGLRFNETDGEVAEIFGTHPPIAKRIALLETMAGVVAAPSEQRRGA
jgi:heat shock protein HtpX